MDDHELFELHQVREERIRKRLPKCERCKRYIDDDYHYNILGVIFCEDCLKDKFRVPTEDFI